MEVETILNQKAMTGIGLKCLGFGWKSIKHKTVLVIMLDFDTFCKIFYFFVRSKMDANYIKAVDSNLNLENSAAMSLVEQVKEFHQMRSVLCKQIMSHFNEGAEHKGTEHKGTGTEQLLVSFCQASGVEHYSCAPLGSTCVVTGLGLNPQNGCLIVVDHQMSYTIDKRFKTMVFNLWYLVHLPNELTLEVFKWLHNQPDWKQGNADVATAVVQVQQYEDNNFAKRAYIKLTSVCKYIQSEMADIPINSKNKVQ